MMQVRLAAARDRRATAPPPACDLRLPYQSRFDDGLRAGVERALAPGTRADPADEEEGAGEDGGGFLGGG